MATTVGWGGAWDGWAFAVNRYKLLHIEWISNKVLLYSSGNYIQSPGINHNENNIKNNVYVYINESLIYTAEINITL